MAPTYGMAEQAAEIIRAQYNNIAPPAVSATMSQTTATSTSATSSSATTKTTQKDGGAISALSFADSRLLGVVLGASGILLSFIYNLA